MTLSINTNYSAAVALASLTSNQGQLDVAKGRLATGLRVQTAADDSIAWVASEKLKTRNNVSEGNLGMLSNASVALDTAVNSASQISTLVRKMQGLLVQAQSPDATAALKVKLNDAFGVYRSQIDGIVKDTSAVGINLIGSTGTLSVALLTSAGATVAAAQQVLITRAVLDSTALNLLPANIALTAVTATSLAAIGTTLEAALATITTQLVANSGQLAAVKSSIDAIKKIVSQNQKAISTYVDADLGAESSQVQALQVKQQLAAQALTIANTNPSVLLKLFKN